jgi:hypothetical protein
MLVLLVTTWQVAVAFVFFAPDDATKAMKAKYLFFNSFNFNLKFSLRRGETQVRKLK